MSQQDRILADLLRGDRLTPMDAMRRYGCMRLAARVWDLRQLGHMVHERLVTVETRDGTAEVAEYWMVPDGELFPVAPAYDDRTAPTA